MSRRQSQTGSGRNGRAGFKRGGYPATHPIKDMKPPTSSPGPGATPSKKTKSSSSKS